MTREQRFEQFKALLLAYTKPVEEMQAKRNGGTRAEWELAAHDEAMARLALYDWAGAALATESAPAGDPADAWEWGAVMAYRERGLDLEAATAKARWLRGQLKRTDPPYLWGESPAPVAADDAPVRSRP